MTTKIHRALAALICAVGAAAAEVPVAPPGAPESDHDISFWTDFTTAWNRAQGTEHTPRALRASLPGVTTADVAWVLAERRVNEETLAGTHASPEYLLLEDPKARLAGVAMGIVSSMSVAASDYAANPTSAPLTDFTEEIEEEDLWPLIGSTLGDLASLRGKVPIKELLWIRVAQDLDERAWRETPLTAHDLLTRPDYGLVRKIIADGLTEMMIKCAGIGADPCNILEDTTIDWCNVLAAACETGGAHSEVLSDSPPTAGGLPER